VQASGANGFPGSLHKLRLSLLLINPLEQNIQGANLFAQNPRIDDGANSFASLTAQIQAHFEGLAV
ncbi:hypothetical protein, partial [Thiorhodococcus mannitoliphagus]|uniref:hypothetical protein n=1 Tax=Thiorhodococcus mannitoliphagus TaxID=329406 RepID=UPI00197E9957